MVTLKPKNLDDISMAESFVIENETTFLSEKQVQFYSRQLIEALSYIHAKGYLHLDIKP